MGTYSGGSRRARYVYFAYPRKAQHVISVKIGITVHLPMRMGALGLTLLFALECEYHFARQLERALHSQFEDCRDDSKWPRAGSTEWFYLEGSLDRLVRFVLAERRWPWDPRQRVILP